MTKASSRYCGRLKKTNHQRLHFFIGHNYNGGQCEDRGQDWIYSIWNPKPRGQKWGLPFPSWYSDLLIFQVFQKSKNKKCITWDLFPRWAWKSSWHCSTSCQGDWGETQITSWGDHTSLIGLPEYILWMIYKNVSLQKCFSVLMVQYDNCLIYIDAVQKWFQFQFTF